MNSIDGLAFLGMASLTRKLRPKVPKIRINVRVSFFGATHTRRPAVPLGYLLASMLDPKLSALMIPSLGTPNKPWRTAWARRQWRLQPLYQIGSARSIQLALKQ